MSLSSSATSSRRTSWVLWLAGGVLWLLVLAAGLYAWRSRGAGGDTAATVVSGSRENQVDVPLWDENGLPEFALTSHTGETITREDLQGQPWVAAFIFTRCRDTCPRITQSLVELSRRFRDQPVRFVPITVDPKNDTPEALARYAEANQAASEQWVWLTGKQTALYDLIQQGFRMPVQEMHGADRKPGFEVAHSNNLLLVDASGVVRGKYNGLDDAEVAELRRELQRLVDEEGEPGPTDADGSLDETPVVLKPEEAKEKPLWNPEGVQEFSFTDRTGGTVTRDDLLGHPWAVCFVFTRCAATCPRLSTEMAELHRRFAETDARFVSLTVDPAYDTPEVLAEYAEIFSAKDNWLFLSGDRNATYELIRDSFYLPVREILGADRKPGFEVLHSNFIMLVDREGRIRGRYNGMKEAEIADLRRELRKLLAEKPAAGDPAENRAGSTGDDTTLQGREPIEAPRPG